MQLYAKPKQCVVLRTKNNLEIYVKLNPRQKWKVTMFKDDKNFVGIERDNVSMIIEKEQFKEYFAVTL